MKNKISPLNSFIFGQKKLDIKLCNKFLPNIFYVFDIYSSAIFIAFAEVAGEVEQTAFISYLSENLKNTNIFNSEPQFYTTNNKIINSHYKINELANISINTSIKEI